MDVVPTSRLVDVVIELDMSVLSEVILLSSDVIWESVMVLDVSVSLLV